VELNQFRARSDRLLEGITTPASINDQVLEFARTLSDKEPLYLDCQPEPWSRQSCCDANVLKYIETNGGRMLCGYRLWYKEPLYIEGERHAIWTDGNLIRDVSFVDTGETKILFVPDDRAFDAAPGKIRHVFDEADRATLATLEAMERAAPMRRLSPKEAWDIMPSYEQWLGGRRMPNYIAKVVR
jgi:hypothetical protein